MAVVNYTKENGTGDSVIITWVLASGDTGAPVGLSDYTDRTVTMTGTFGAAVTLDGSNDKLTWMTQANSADTDISKTANAMEAIVTNPVWTRPAAGGITSVTVIINAVRGK